MRKATGLLMRSELAMAISAVFKEFIEVRILAMMLEVRLINSCRMLEKTQKIADSHAGELEEAA